MMNCYGPTGIAFDCGGGSGSIWWLVGAIGLIIGWCAVMNILERIRENKET